MPQDYVIRSGDCLISIAERFAIDPKRIWEHGANADLRRRRGNPNVLHPGDVLHIPDLDDAPESVALEQVHTFRIPTKCHVRIVLYDWQHAPMKNVPYHYTVGGVDEPEKRTGSDGMAETKVARSVTEVELTVPWGTFTVLVGHLDPANTVRGAQQRLNNLGFDAGPPDGDMGPRTRRALARFQELESLEVTAWLDQPTIRRLRKLNDGQTLSGAPEQLENMAPPEISVEPPPEVKTKLTYDDVTFEPEPGWG